MGELDEIRRTLGILRQELRENEAVHEALVLVLRGHEAQLRLLQAPSRKEIGNG